jgi:hypothetical protein
MEGHKKHKEVKNIQQTFQVTQKPKSVQVSPLEDVMFTGVVVIQFKKKFYKYVWYSEIST